MKYYFHLTIIFFIFTTHLFGQNGTKQIAKDYNTSDNLHLITHWGKGMCKGHALMDNLCIIGSGCVIEVMDASNPDQLELISDFTVNSPVIQIEAKNDLMFYGCENGTIGAVNLENPTHPELLGEVSHPGLVELGLQGEYVISISTIYMKIWDFSDPQSPEYVSSPVSTDWFYGFSVSDGYAWVAAGLDGFSVYDLNDPQNPYKLSSLSLDGYCDDAWRDGDFAYCANEEYGVRMIDVSDPGSPELINTLEGLHANHIYAANGYVHCTTSGPSPTWCYYSLIDVHDPMNAFICDTKYLGNIAPEISVNDKLVYISHTSGLSILDITNPNIISTTNFLDTPDATYDVHCRDSLLYLFEMYDGLWVMDISNEACPVKVTSRSCGVINLGFAFGDELLLVYGTEGVWIIEISEPASPVVLGVIGTEMATNTATVQGNMACLSNASFTGNPKLVFYDLSDPANPEHLSDFFNVDGARGLKINGSILYVSDRESFKIIDISNPGDTELLSSTPLETLSITVNVEIRGEYAFLPRGSEGIAVFNIEDPANPELVNTISQAGIEYKDIFMDGDTLYVAQMDNGMQILDVSDILNPVEVTAIATMDMTSGIHKSGNSIFLADSRAGFYIYSFDSIPTQINNQHFSEKPIMARLTPNPAINSSLFEAELSEPGNGTFEIINFQGNCVYRENFYGLKQGRFSVKIDRPLPNGNKLQAGSYLIILTVNQKLKYVAKLVHTDL